MLPKRWLSRPRKAGESAGQPFMPSAAGQGHRSRPLTARLPRGCSIVVSDGKEPRTMPVSAALRSLLGLGDQATALGDSVLIMIDRQNTYRPTAVAAATVTGPRWSTVRRRAAHRPRRSVPGGWWPCGSGRDSRTSAHLRTWQIAWSRAGSPHGVAARRALCGSAGPLPGLRPRRGRVTAAARSSGPGRGSRRRPPVATPSKRQGTARGVGTSSRAATKGIPDVPGPAEHTPAPASWRARATARAPFTAVLPSAGCESSGLSRKGHRG